MTVRIGVLINSYAGGGAERSSLLTAASWPRGEDVCVIACLAEGPYQSEIPQRVSTTEIGVWPSLANIAGFTRKLRTLVGVNELDAVMANGYGLNQAVLLAQLFSRLRGLSVIVVEHNTLSVALADRFPNRLMRGAVRVLTRWLYRRADAIVGVSDGVSRDLEATLSLPSGSVITIYNPVDTERITAAMTEPVPEALSRAFEALRRPIVITTGRLVTQKAHRDLLAAFALLPEPTRGSLVILGEGPLRGDLEQQAQQLGIAERVWMPGFVENPWWLMARSDVFALSSRWEGHPRVVLEALACGIPVVSTDCPSGPRESHADKPGARLAPIGDPSALAQAIDELLSSPTQAASGISLDGYNPSRVAARYAEVALEAHRSRARRAHR